MEYVEGHPLDKMDAMDLLAKSVVDTFIKVYGILIVSKQQFNEIYHAQARSTFCFDEHYHQQSILASFPFYAWNPTNSNYHFGEWVYKRL